MAEEKVTGISAGKSCPYCHTELDVGDKGHRCDRCGALHHADCWVEGDGCAVFGCDSSTEGLQEAEPSTALDDSTVTLRETRLPRESSAGEDFVIERRSVRPEHRWPDRRRLGAAIGGILVLGALAAGALIVTGRGEDRVSTPAKPTKPTAAEIKKMKQEAAEAAKRKRRNQILQRLEIQWVSDPDGNWEGFLPGGERWGEPRGLGDQNGDEYNPRYRTVVDMGDEDGFVIVDTTPAEDPTGNPENYVVGERSLKPTPISHGDFQSAEMVSYKGGTEVCGNDGPCALGMLSDGEGGGVTILAMGESMDQSKAIVKKFAATVERDY